MGFYSHFYFCINPSCIPNICANRELHNSFPRVTHGICCINPSQEELLGFLKEKGFMMLYTYITAKKIWKLQCFVFLSAPKFVVFIIRFVDVAKDIAERNYYLFAHELVNFRKV